MTSFVFDVDGTLTNARETIDPVFEKFMQEFVTNNTCYICTGSDRSKTIEQIGESLTNQFELVFHCSGNHVYKGNTEYKKNNWQLSSEQYKFLEDALASSLYNEKTGNHIEQRIGSANFSICGRNANFEQRQRYSTWEKQHQARKLISEQFNQKFGNTAEALVAGETSIDIFKLGHNKGQALDYIDDTVVFFGDKCFPGGNDWDIAKRSDVYHQIDNGWKQTFEILKKQYHKTEIYEDQ